jgi:branched-chain amino acid transport system permease protein
LLLSGCADRAALLTQACEAMALPLVGSTGAVDADAVPPVGTDVVVAYRAPGSAERRWFACGFDQDEQGVPVLARVVSDREGPLSASAVFFLREYGRLWADRAASTLASTTPDGSAPARAAPLAYALQQLINAATPAGIYGLLAASLALAYAQVGRIHLALGDFGMLGATAALPLIALAATGEGHVWGSGPALLLFGIALAIGTSAAWSATSGAGPFHRLWREHGSVPLIGTVAIGLFIRELVRLVHGARDVWVLPILSGPTQLSLGSAGSVVVGPAPVLVTLVIGLVALSLGLVLARTQLGRAMRACADDAGRAGLLGIEARRVRLAAFALAGGCASTAMLLTLVVYGTLGAEAGFTLGLKALTAAIVGGMGSVGGALLGGVLIGLLETFWAGYIGGPYRELVVFGVLIAVLVLRPQGIIPRPVLEPGHLSARAHRRAPRP